MAANSTGNTAGMAATEFHLFTDCWLSQQFHLLNKLNSASDEYKERRLQHFDHDDTDEVLENLFLTQLVDRVVQHYEYYYQTKLRCISHDPVSMLYPPWHTMSDSDQFLGSWYPNLAYNLVYSKIGDPSNLSPEQVQQLEELQINTVKEESLITEKMDADDSARVGPVMDWKEEELEIILQTADFLRIKTLKEVVGILSPIQAVNFLIAAAELHVYF